MVCICWVEVNAGEMNGEEDAALYFCNEQEHCSCYYMYWVAQLVRRDTAQQIYSATTAHTHTQASVCYGNTEHAKHKEDKILL